MKPALPLRSFRDYLVGDKGRFILEAQRSVTLPPVRHADLYVHIPFCRRLCPYCPYNRVLYDEQLANAYIDATLTEIDGLAERLGAVSIGSVYFGGGTPTVALDGIARILEHIGKRFGPTGPVAVETIPTDLDPRTLRVLKGLGVGLLSIGVQSFDDRFLKRIGRGYRSDILAPAIDRTLCAGFDAVNVDLMFALPGESADEAVADLDTALALGAEQVTLYPLFTFPYTTVGRHRELNGVGFPSLPARRRMYRAIHDDACAHGLKRVSVWGFKRDGGTRFSSVTRDQYIGIGAGSATKLPGLLTFNTFSVPEYIRSCNEGRLPVALVMRMTAAMEAWYWLYWRIYDTAIPKAGLHERFAGDARISRLLTTAAALHLLADCGDHFELTERGAFWMHLMQNYYVLDYINTVWTAAMRTPWPASIEL